MSRHSEAKISESAYYFSKIRDFLSFLLYFAAVKATYHFFAIFLLAFGAALSSLQAQNKVYAAIGLNASYAQPDSLNYILDQFNLDNPTAEKAMPLVRLPLGLDAHLGGNLNGVLLDINFAMRVWAGTARGAMQSNGGQTITKMRYNSSTVDIGLGYFVVNRELSQWAVGASLDFGQLRVQVRRGSAAQIATQPWGRTVNELNLAASIFVQGMIELSRAPKMGLYLRPYYQFGFVRNDFGPANLFLRPRGSLSDPFLILQRPSNAGLKIGLYFGG